MPNIKVMEELVEASKVCANRAECCGRVKKEHFNEDDPIWAMLEIAEALWTIATTLICTNIQTESTTDRTDPLVSIFPETPDGQSQ